MVHKNKTMLLQVYIKKCTIWFKLWAPSKAFNEVQKGHTYAKCEFNLTQINTQHVVPKLLSLYVKPTPI